MKKVIASLALLLACVAPAVAGDDAAIKAQLKKLRDGDEKAAEPLVKLGGKAVPALVEFLQQAGPNDVSAAWFASAALGRIGAPAVPALRDGLTKGNPVYALSALKQVGPAARGALPAVLDIVKRGPTPADPSHAAAYPLAVEVVGSLGPDAKEAVPLLIQQLTPKNPAAAHVIVALGRIGGAAREAVPALTEVEKSGPPALRLHARDSLKKIKG